MKGFAAAFLFLSALSGCSGGSDCSDCSVVLTAPLLRCSAAPIAPIVPGEKSGVLRLEELNF